MAKTYTLEEMGAKLKQANPGKLEKYSNTQLAQYYLEAKPQAQSIVHKESVLGGIAKGIGKSATSVVKGASEAGEGILKGALRLILPQAAEEKLGIDQSQPQVSTAQSLQNTAEKALDVTPGSLTDARTGAQKVGKFVGDTAQFLIPSGGALKAGKALEAAQAAKGAGKLAQFGARIAPQVATDIGVSTAQTGDIGEGLKTGALSATLPIAGAGIKKVVSPLKKVPNILAEGAGKLTGTQGNVIKEAFTNPDVLKYAKLSAQDVGAFQDDLLSEAQKGLKALRATRQSQYLSKLDQIKADSKEVSEIGEALRNKTKQLLGDRKISVAPQTDNLGKTLNKFDFSNSTIVGNENVVERALNEVLSNTDNTAAGLDVLKKRLGDYIEQIPDRKGPAKTLLIDLQDTLSKELKEKVAGYSDLTKGYRETSELIDEIEQAFSLKNGKNRETAIKKIMGSLRENNEQRKELLDVLGKDFKAKVAGAQLASATPRGLSGVITPQSAILGGAAAVSGLLRPEMLFFLFLTSPRLYAKLGNVVSKIPKSQLENGTIAPMTQKLIRSIMLEATQGED